MYRHNKIQQKNKLRLIKLKYYSLSKTPYYIKSLIMGCNTSKQVAIQELSDIHEILKIENSKLEEEKENLLRDQIDKPAEDKEIQQSIQKNLLVILKHEQSSSG